MLTFCRGLLVVLLATASASGRDDDEPKLEYNFDKPFTQTWTTKVAQKITVYTDREKDKKNAPVTQTQEVQVKVLWTPEPPGEDKTTRTLKLKIESVTIKAEGGKDKIAFDSTQPPDEKVAFDAALRKLIGAELTVELKEKKVTVSGVDKALEGLPAEQKAQLAMLVGTERVQRLAEAAFPTLPQKKGAMEKQTSNVAVGPLGRFKTETVLTHDGVKDKVATLKSEVKWEFKPGAEAADAVHVKSMQPATADLDGALEFNTETGLLVKSTLASKKQDKPTQVKLTIGKTEVDADVEQEYIQTVEGAAK